MLNFSNLLFVAFLRFFHDSRHTCATTVMLAHNVCIENVAKILGHKNLKMTQHYAKVLDSSIIANMGDVTARYGGVRA